jgi:hypothetical protein
MYQLDSGPLAVSLVFMGAICAPFFYYYFKNKAVKRQLESKIISNASTSGGKIDRLESWRNKYILGLDSLNSILYYFQDEPNSAVQSIFIRDLIDATVSIESSEFNENSSGTKMPGKITIELYSTGNKKNPIQLEIYNEAQFTDLTGEEIIAKNWVELIREKIK